MTAKHYPNVVGALDSGIAAADTTISSPGLAALPAIAAPAYVWICMDPLRAAGAPEWMKITAHTAGATTATVTRGEEGSTARDHLTSTDWVHAVAASELDAFSSFTGCRSFRSAALAVPNAAWTAIPLDAETFDTHGFHDNATNPSRFTVPAGKAGKYRISAQVTWSANATGGRYAGIRKNGLEMAVAAFVPSTANTAAVVTDVLDLVVGDYVEMWGWQNSGGSLNVAGGTSQTFFSIEHLGS